MARRSRARASTMLGARRALQGRPRAQHIVVGFEIFGRLGQDAALLDLGDADRQARRRSGW